MLARPPKARNCNGIVQWNSISQLRGEFFAKHNDALKDWAIAHLSYQEMKSCNPFTPQDPRKKLSFFVLIVIYFEIIDLSFHYSLLIHHFHWFNKILILKKNLIVRCIARRLSLVLLKWIGQHSERSNIVYNFFLMRKLGPVLLLYLKVEALEVLKITCNSSTT